MSLKTKNNEQVSFEDLMEDFEAEYTEDNGYGEEYFN